MRSFISIDFVTNIKKELSTSLFRRMQVKSKKIKMPGFIDVELESDSSSDSE